ncbi:hypothetical protein QO010_004584 [Caulobacter ginsengisoli]|uniref:Glycerophosphoryl diester phosphodiesterase membrane domain-containing protein n=1 Tax=Caulobacter ginsengisoli TaxID=400775 RepID=A0ABU0IXQ2_9CAUL|nr:hypothetical protein [Caulobacter ginsengisoli]MDQ0466788.1 hypothetical protein [Caulobacter ginsengisoli]
MQDFSFKDAALSGYRLLRERPMTAVFWFIWSLICGTATIAAMAQMIGPQMMAMQEIQRAGPTTADPATVMNLTRQIFSFQIVFALPFGLVTGAISLGAVNRAILRPQGSALGYLRFGADELRLVVSCFVIAIILFVSYFATVIGATIALVIGAGPGALKAGLAAAPFSAKIPAIVVGLLGAAAMIFLMVKLSLAAAQTVAEKGIRIFSSWGLTKGRFWKILGVYVVAGLPVLVLWIGILALTVATHPAGGPPQGLMQAIQPDLSSLNAAFAPRYLLIYALQAAVGALGLAAVGAPAAYICQALLGAAADDDGDGD